MKHNQQGADIVLQILSVAEGIEDSNPDIYKEIIAISEDLLNHFKTAQYLGSQGYWIRNSRCWQNCYRQKRSQTPEKSAQDVWFECFEEYNESTRKYEDNQWSKYAENFLPLTSMKFAGVNDYSLVKNKNLSLSKLIEAKINQGTDIGSAIFSSIQELETDDDLYLLQSADRLQSIASRLPNNQANKISNIIESLIKQSGLFDNIRGVAKGIGGVINDKIQDTKLNYNIHKMIGNIDIAVSRLAENFRSIIDNKQALIAYLQNFKPRNANQQQQINTAIQGIQAIGRLPVDAVMRNWENIKLNVNGLPSVSPTSSSAPSSSTVPNPTSAPSSSPTSASAPSSSTAPNPTSNSSSKATPISTSSPAPTPVSSPTPPATATSPTTPADPASATKPTEAPTATSKQSPASSEDTLPADKKVSGVPIKVVDFFRANKNSGRLDSATLLEWIKFSKKYGQKSPSIKSDMSVERKKILEKIKDLNRVADPTVVQYLAALDKETSEKVIKFFDSLRA